MRLRIPSPFRKRKTTAETSVVKERPLRFAEVQDRKKKRRKLIFLFGCVAILTVVVVIIFLLRSFFLISHVSCVIENVSCDDELVQSSQALKGKSMLSQLRVSHAFLHSKIERLWPNGIKVHYSQPELLLSFAPSKEGIAPYSLTKDGIIVHVVGQMESLPVVSDVQLEMLHTGDHVDQRTFAYYDHLMQGLRTLHIQQISSISTNDDVITVQLDASSRAVMDKEGISAELQDLQTFLSVSTVERNGKVIDFRFHNPVVK